MKKLFFITLIYLFINFSYGLSIQTYSMTFNEKQKLDEISFKIFNYVDKKYKIKSSKERIYWTLVDTIDGYIVLHRNKISIGKIIRLLYLKTKIIEHMGYSYDKKIKIKIKK